MPGSASALRLHPIHAIPARLSPWGERASTAAIWEIQYRKYICRHDLPGIENIGAASMAGIMTPARTQSDLRYILLNEIGLLGRNLGTLLGRMNAKTAGGFAGLRLIYRVLLA